MKTKKTKQKRLFDPLSVLFVLGVIAADFVVWYQIFFIATAASVATARIYFLDVGQGDAELIILPGNIKIMTDAGPDTKVLQSLAKILPQSDNYIDLAIISHPELDHFGGFNSLLDHYRVGAFIYNGRDAAPGEAAWSALRAKIQQENIPLITLGEGDKIHYANNNEIDIISPNSDFDQSAELNDTGIVELIKMPGLSALFTADTGSNVESALLASRTDLRADILKVPHHGSKYASDSDFLRAVSPNVTVIEVGAKNSFGQPSKEALARLASSTNAQVFRTDEDGTIAVSIKGAEIEVSKEK